MTDQSPTNPALRAAAKQVVLLVILLTTSAYASDTSALIAKALDKQTPIELDTTLPEAMKTIAEQTTVRIQADPAVWDLLPWGEETNVKATIKNRTLRDGLGAIGRKLGLEVCPTDQAVELRPTPALRRLGRRATVQELAVLDLMASTPMALSTDEPTLKQLLSEVDQRLKKSPFAVDCRVADGATIKVPRNASVADALEAIHEKTAATWHPWGKSILIVSKTEQVRNQLTKPVTTRYAGVDVGQVIQDLAKRAGVRFVIDPGVYERIPKDYRPITLTLDTATVQQSLDTISGYTGLGFEVQDDGVHVTNAFVPGPSR